jgi:zinc transport system substrate-binding protein
MAPNRRFSLVLVLILAALVTVISGCRITPTASSGDGKLTVAVSIVPQKSFVEAICGDHVRVVSMVPPGYSPENYELTPQEAQLLDEAAIYFAIGVPVETSGILPLIQGKKIVDLAAEAAKVYPDLYLDENERDPHVWLSPRRVKVMAEAIEREMSLLDPANAGEYLAGKTAFLARLDQLDTGIKARFEGLTGRSFFIFHPSLGYLADDYGLNMLALQQHGKEATPQHLQEMIDKAVASKARTVFAQAEIDSRQLDVFADETGCKIIILDPLSADYINNMQQMTKLIAEALKDG